MFQALLCIWAIHGGSGLCVLEQQDEFPPPGPGHWLPPGGPWVHHRVHWWRRHQRCAPQPGQVPATHILNNWWVFILTDRFNYQIKILNKNQMIHWCNDQHLFSDKKWLTWSFEKNFSRQWHFLLILFVCFILLRLISFFGNTLNLVNYMQSYYIFWTNYDLCWKNNKIYKYSLFYIIWPETSQ